jgi:hypothetical protein
MKQKRKGVPTNNTFIENSLKVAGVAILPFIVHLIILGFATENLSNEWAKILPILDTDNNGEISSDEVDMRSDEAASETIEILNELRSNAQLISANINFYIQLNPNTFSYYEDQLGSVLGSISA